MYNFSELLYDRRDSQCPHTRTAFWQNNFCQKFGPKQGYNHCKISFNERCIRGRAKLLISELSVTLLEVRFKFNERGQSAVQLQKRCSSINRAYTNGPRFDRASCQFGILLAARDDIKHLCSNLAWFWEVGDNNCLEIMCE